MEPFATCQQCGLPIGVYERVAVVEAEELRTSSLAREPALGRAGETLFHESCALQSSVAARHH